MHTTRNGIFSLVEEAQHFGAHPRARAARTQAAVRSHTSSNLVEESFGVAVQIGQLSDSSVIARFVDFLTNRYASEPDWHAGWGEGSGTASSVRAGAKAWRERLTLTGNNYLARELLQRALDEMPGSISAILSYRLVSEILDIARSRHLVTWSDIAHGCVMYRNIGYIDHADLTRRECPSAPGA